MSSLDGGCAGSDGSGSYIDPVLIEWTELELGEEVGAGSASEVWAGTWRHCAVAVKLLKAKGHSLSIAALDELRHFVGAGKRLWSPYLQTVHGVCMHRGRYAVVAELLPHSLSELLQPRPPTSASGRRLSRTASSDALLDEFARLRVLCEVAQGLDYLHSRRHPMVHGAVKARNVLLDNQLRAQLGDVGLHTIRREITSFSPGDAPTDAEEQLMVHDVRSMAPEVINAEAPTTASDVYSFAVLCWETLAARTPFEGMTNTPILMRAIADKGLRPSVEDLPAWVPAELRDLVAKALSKDAAARPAMAEFASVLATVYEERTSLVINPAPEPDAEDQVWTDCFESKIEAGNEEAAAVDCQSAAEQGDPEAMFTLGVCYANGVGVKKSAKNAALWWRKAAAKGHTEAQVQLGIRAANDGEHVVAVKWFRKASEAGHALALYNMGVLWELGRGTPGGANAEQAFALYEKAAKAKHPAAMFRLGLCAASGVGCVKDPKLAADWFRRAALLGHADAMFNCGVCAVNGLGVSRSAEDAMAWYAAAAEQGHALAASNLAHLEQTVGEGKGKGKGKAPKGKKKK